MTTTERKHWVNGYQVRGKGFKTITLSLGSIGLMVSGYYVPSVKLFKLVGDK